MTAHVPSIQEVRAARVSYVAAWLRHNPGDTKAALAAFGEDFPAAERLLALISVFEQTQPRRWLPRHRKKLLQG